MEKERKRLILEWIKKAEHDLKVAKLTLTQLDDCTDVVCFHCQQAVEKYLKAYLIFSGTNFDKTHSLSFLSGLLPQSHSLPQLILSKCEELEDFAVDVRYPTGWADPSEEEAAEAVSKAEDVIVYLKQQLTGL